MAWLSSIANYLLVVPSKRNDHQSRINQINLVHESEKLQDLHIKKTCQTRNLNHRTTTIPLTILTTHRISNHVSVCLWIHQLPDLRSKFLGLMKGCKVKAWKRCPRDVCSHGKQHIGEDWWHERMKYGEVFGTSWTLAVSGCSNPHTNTHP